MKNVKIVVQACKLSKSLSKKPWGSSKELLIIYYFCLPDEEVKIRFINFSVFQFIFENFDWGREVYHFMDLKRGDKGADTDLMFQFCLPNAYLADENRTPTIKVSFYH